ncbi:MAG: hypothetical protein ACI9DK_003267 [Vicingaceae bacterium]|jgi:hypothetical protein
MTEWILIITLNLAVAGDSITDYKAEIIDGFTSEKRCLAAAQIIGTKISNQIVNHKAAMGISLERKSGNPIVFSNCVKIEK